MYGLQVAFKDYKIGQIWNSPWADPIWKNFTAMFQMGELVRAIRNTVVINIYNLVIGFPFVIFLALMFNELRVKWLKRVTQTFVYLPYFISWVVFSGIIVTFLSSDGLANQLLRALGLNPIMFLQENGLIRGIFVVTGIIKGAGYSTIIYLAAIAGVNPELYDSALVDGANRFHMIRHITLPRIYPTIAVLLILEIAHLFASNFDQVFNLYNVHVFERGDTIATYMYRVILRGTGNRYDVGVALGLLFNTISFVILLAANKVISKMNVMGIF
jgi:putative aldouronate transport system permease protein